MGAVSQQLLALQHSRSGGAAPSASSIPFQLNNLSLAASSEADTSSPDRRTGTMSDHFRECRSENGSSRDTNWTMEQSRAERDLTVQTQERNVNGQEAAVGDDREKFKQTVIRRVAKSDRVRLKDVVCDPIDVLAKRLPEQPDELAEELKTELRAILGAAKHRDDFALLQKLLLSRTDLSSESLSRANRIQLELLVAIKTGIQAFLHPDICVPRSTLIEVFFCKRCRNVGCQSPIPGDDCTCEVCTSKNGFCNACMCTICNKFDFEVNTCRWIGCDCCAHWAHTDCAMRVGHISMGNSKDGAEMLFSCKACKNTSTLLGWAQDVLSTCAPDWKRDQLIRELASVSRIFQGSQDDKGLRVYMKAKDLLDKMKAGADGNMVCQEIQRLFQELEVEDTKEDESSKMIEPQEACSRMAEVVQEVMSKLEAVSEEKVRALKKARLALETSDRELAEKRKELAELQLERQQKQQQIEELETIVGLKQAEGDMFQLRADEARQEAEGLQHISFVRSDNDKDDYVNRYLKLRLNKAESEQRYLLEKLQDDTQSDPLQGFTKSQIQDIIKRVCTKNMVNQTEKSGLYKLQ